MRATHSRKKAITAALLGAVAVCLVAISGASAAPGLTDLSLTKDDTADPVTKDGSFGYVITVKNSGANDAVDATVTDTLPSQVTYSSVVTTAGSCVRDKQKVTCELGQLNAGASAIITINVKAASTGTASNTAVVSTTSGDSDAANNLDTETTAINAAPTTAKTKKPKKNSKRGCATPTITGTAGNDSIAGTAGSDIIVGLTGDDTILAGPGNDVICGGGGSDVVSGGTGSDYVSGDAGRDRLFGSADSDLILGGFGKDKLRGNGGNDGLDGGPRRDRCRGGAGRDRVANCP